MNDLRAFSTKLNENDFFDWIGWERLFRLDRMGTAFSTGSDGDGFFDWVGWGRLFHELNGDGFFK